jgi:TolA-binding protein
MEALRQWLAGHADSPLRARARLEMAELYERTGRPDSAAVVLEDLLRESGDEAWGAGAWLRLADLQRRMGHSERALTTYRRFLDRHSGSSLADSIAFLMARIQEEDLNRTQAALKTYQELAAGGPAGRWAGKAAFSIGRLLETAEQYEQAREAYLSFSQHYPHSPMYLKAQERIAYLTDFRIPEEPLALEAMVDIQDQLASGVLTEEEVDLRLADIYLRHLRNFDRAAAALERFLDRHAGSNLTDEALYRLSRCHALKAEMLRIDGNRSGAEEERQAAARTCRRLLRDHPGSRRADDCALRIIADIIAETESDSLTAWSERRELYETFLRTYPASEWRPLALLQVGEALHESGAGDSLMLARADSVFALVTDRHGSSAWADSAAWSRMAIAHQRGDDRAAMVAGQDFLWDFPDSPLRSRVFFLQAGIHEENGDHLQAARLYRSVAEDFPYHDLTEQAWLSQARALRAAENLSEAQRVLERFRQRYPDSERRDESALLLARYAAARGQTGRARELLAEVETASGGEDPDPAIQLAIGDIYRRLGDADKALARYQSVREAHRGQAAGQEALERMAAASLEVGLYASAGEYYQQALAGDPDEEARIALSAGRIRCLYRQGLIKEAARARKEFAGTYRQEAEQIAGLLLEEAQAYLEREEDEEAGKALEKILEDYPETLTAQEADYRLGIMALSAGRYREALERFTALLDRYPETDLEGLVFFKMASALYGLEQYPDAALQYRRAAERISDDDLRADALFNAGICRARMNDWEGAISAYRELLEEFPEHPERRTWSLRLGFAYLEAGQAGRALETFTRIDPGGDDELGAELQFWIGECYFKMDRYERAAEEYLRVRFLYPRQVRWAATAEYNAGVSYQKLGRTEEARTIFRKLVQTRGTGDEWGRMAQEKLHQLGE